MTDTAKKRKRKPIVVETAGVHVRLFKRGAQYWLDVRDGENRQRVSAKTSDRSTAEANAKALGEAIARQKLFGVTPDTLTLGQLFDAYERHKGSALTGQYKRAAKTREGRFLASWGPSMHVLAISQTSVDSYSAERRRAFIAAQQRAYATKEARRLAAHRRMHGADAALPPSPTPTFRELRDGAIEPEFRWLSSVFNWACKHKLSDGRRLLSVNPLHDCKWPHEQNIRRPVASHDRFTRTLEQCGTVDAMGRLRLALILARYTARRIDAILHLRASDVLRSRDSIRAVLAELGENEGLADAMTHGAIYWRAEHDKQGRDRVTPISATVRAEIDAYLKANPRVGTAPLLPSVETPADAPELTLPRTTATKWLARAERLAALPKLRGGLWHAYRRLWSTERKHLPDVDVAEAGGWTGTKAMKLSYQQSTAAGVLAAVMASA